MHSQFVMITILSTLKITNWIMADLFSLYMVR